jgi:DNA-binding NarL/FixJ family response regulator
MIYAYCRVSTKKQETKRQIDNIKRHYNLPPENFFEEVYTGRAMSRPVWISLREKVKSGDTIVFDSVSRMSRNATEGIADYMDLYNAGVDLVFINEPHINTAKYRESISKAKEKTINLNVTTGDVMIDKFIDFLQDWVNDFLLHSVGKDIELEFKKAEDEIADLSRRTKEGMLAKGTAKKISEARSGKKYRTVASLKNRLEILNRSVKFGGSLSNVDLTKILEISSRTVERYTSELADELSVLTKAELEKKLKDEIKSKSKKK